MTVTESEVERLRERVQHLANELDVAARYRHLDGHPGRHDRPYPECTADECVRSRELIGEYALT